jgi:hypothetical protein
MEASTLGTPLQNPYLFLHIESTMPTELPYAADAEVSLSFDELDVCNPEHVLFNVE